mmetsp:Transcript_34036/g.55228  ORF Transcript_34036/g.55228 Transcript_34036/m.55228 type:complete len:382 (+) Transcript_34036:2-1147(+)
MRVSSLVAIVLLLLTLAAQGVGANMKGKKQLKMYTIDLDAAPEERWREVAQDHKNYIRAMLDACDLIFETENPTVVKQISEAIRLPSELVYEMKGIASVVDVSYKKVLVGNIFYELSRFSNILSFSERACTSIVAQHRNGTIYHARNQDYPRLFAPLMVRVRFVRNKGELVFTGTTFAGTVGIMTGMAVNGFGVSIDARADKGNITQFVAAAAAGASVFPFITRHVLNSSTSYTDALSKFSTIPMISTGYIILSGIYPGEGAVITRNASSEGTNIWSLPSSPPPFNAGSASAAPTSQSWFRVETNYDHDSPPPATDDRRDPAVRAMEAIGRDNISLAALWEVLSSPPVFNKHTIHTDLLVSAWGEYRSYKRHVILDQQQNA